MSDPIDLLATECRLIERVVLRLAEDDFALPTRCPPWDVKVLLAHMWRDVDRIEVSLLTPSPTAADTDAVGYWRAYDPVADAPEISARSLEIAGEFATGTELARSFAAHWPECVEMATDEHPGRLVQTWGPAMLLEEYMKTRVLEIVVHGLDLARALAREPWSTGAGRAMVRKVLIGLLGAEPPARLGWDDLTFIEKGTGRLRLTDDDRASLGQRTALFPLLA